MKAKEIQYIGPNLFAPKDAWDALSMREKAEMMRVAVRNGITNLQEIRQKYNEFAEGGNTENDEEELPPIVPFEQKPEVIITPDQEYNQYLNTLPDNQRFTPNDAYDSYFYWKLNGRPRNFEEAYNKGMFHYDHSDNGYHANSIAFGENGVGYFMKPKTHDTVHMETDWYNKGIVTEEGGKRRPVNAEELKELEDFRRRFELTDDPNRPNYFMYAPRKQEHSLGGPLVEWALNEYAEGGGIHIKPSHRGRLTELKKRTGKSEAELFRNGNAATRKMITFARNARKWKHGGGGNLYGGESEDTQQMQIGREYWLHQDDKPSFFSLDFPINGGTLQEVVITGSKSKQEEARKQRLAEMQAVLDKYQNDYLTTSNDNTWVESRDLRVQATRQKNPHLAQRAVEGAKAHAAWAKEHPILNAVSMGLGALPFAVAATPLMAIAGEAAYPVLTNPYVDAALTSGFAGHGLNHAINEGVDGWGDATMTALEVTPLGKVVKPVAQGVANTAKEVYDSGALWDAYTTFGGRFGNYGGNMATNIYGTAARRYGLPDKARVPADNIRKIKSDVAIDNEMVDITGSKDFLGNPHINTTIDRPVVSHGWGWDGADTYITPTRSFLDQTRGTLKSIEPSDMFSNGTRVIENPRNVTLISGDVKALEKAKAAGMQTLSSPRLRRMYSDAYDKYQQAGMFGKHPKKEQHWLDYATEVQRLQAQRGTPTLADFRLLEEETGLSAGVAPMSEMQNAIKQLRAMQNANIQDIMAGKVQPYVYPNGRVVDWDKVGEELELINRAKYNKVFYDPASHVESDWQVANGVK